MTMANSIGIDDCCANAAADSEGGSLFVPAGDDADGADGADEGARRSVVGRIASIIDAFDDGRTLLSLNDLCLATDLPKSTAHRFAEQLRRLGWLERDGLGYRVGLRLFEVGGLAPRRSRLCETALPHLQSLSSKTDLAVQLAILDGPSVIYLDRIPVQGFKLPTRDGGRQPAYCTALGKSMLAFAGNDDIVDVIDCGLARRTSTTIVSPTLLRDELERIRDDGVAFDRGEAYRGLACVAAPIRNSGRAIGAVSVTGTVQQVDFDRVTPLVRHAAAGIWSDRFGRARSAS